MNEIPSPKPSHDVRISADDALLIAAMLESVLCLIDSDAVLEMGFELPESQRGRGRLADLVERLSSVRDDSTPPIDIDEDVMYRYGAFPPGIAGLCELFAAELRGKAERARL